MREVRLEWLAIEALSDLQNDEARAEVWALIDQVAQCPVQWPEPGGEESLDWFGRRGWVSVVAYLDGLEVRDIGWCG